MGRRALLLALGALVAAVAWVAFGGSAGGPATSAVPGSPDTLGEAAIVGAGVPAEADAAAEPSSDAEPSPERTEAIGGELPEGTRAVEVRVIHRDSRTPVGHAKVRYSAPGFDWQKLEPAERELAEQLSGDQERMLSHFGAETVADRDGVARVVLNSEWAMVVARHGDLYGELNVNLREVTPDDGWTVEVERDHTVGVRVVDEAGHPVGAVTVALYVKRKPWRGDQVTVQPERRTRTDADTGIATIAHLQRLARQVVADDDGRRRARAGVWLPGLGERGPRFDLEAPPGEPLEVSLADTGRVILELADAVSDPSKTPAVQLAVRDGRRWLVQAEAGRAVFEHVALHTRYLATAWTTVGQATAEFDGPSMPGQEVVHRFTLTGETTTLVGRIIDEQRELAASARFRLHFGGRGTQVFSTDGEGRFRVVLARWYRTAVADGSSIVMLDDERQPLPLVGYLSFQGKLESGEHDAGDIVLGESPIIVDGRLTGDGSDRLQRVRLSLQSADPSRSGRNGQLRWVQARSASVRRDDDGWFEVRGRTPPGKLRLVVSSQRHRPVAPLEVTAGTRGLEIPLDAGCDATALVQLDEGLDSSALQLQLLPAGRSSTDRRLQANISGLRNGRVTYRWAGIAAGSYRLRVTAHAHRDALAVIDGLEIAATDDGEPQRLPDIDLRGQLRKIEVRIVDAAGEPIDTRGVAVVDDAAATAEVGAFDVYSKVSMTLAVAELDLLVAIPGYRLGELRGLDGDATLRLDAAPRITLALAGPEPAPDLRLDAVLKPLDSVSAPDPRRYRTQWSPGRKLADLLRGDLIQRFENGEATLAVRNPGRYSVAVRVRPPRPKRAWTIEIDERITVRDVPGEQTFTIELRENAFSGKSENGGK